MLITVCLPATPNATAAEMQLPTCRSFSDPKHMQEWLQERGIVMPCGAVASRVAP